MKKRKIIAILIYVILLLAAIVAIESLINNKRDKLYSDMSKQLTIPFNKTEGANCVETLAQATDDEVEYVEVSIPPFPEDGDKWEKRYWTNKFSGVEHLYKITDGGWTMCGKTNVYFGSKDHPYENVHIGIQDYVFVPYMICVPHGFEFNSQIAKTIIEESLEKEKVLCKPDKYDVASEAQLQSNDYYEIESYNLPDDRPELNMPFRNERIGTDPIYENGKLTGYYWFNVITIGSYKVLYAYKNCLTWAVVERSNSSLRDRVLYYCLAFIALTSALICFLFKLRRKHKANTLMLTESLRERLLRYADPVNFLSSSQPQRVTIAKDIYEKLLDLSAEDPQVEDIADDLKEKIGINLITEQEKTYLINLCKSIMKKKSEQIETKKLVNNLYVLLADINSVRGKDYSTILKIVSQILNYNNNKR